MPSSQAILLVAVVTAFVLAMPAPVDPGGLQKRSFIVPRQLNRDHPTGLNGPAAMRKVFRKYNFKVEESFAIEEQKANRKLSYREKRPIRPSTTARNQSGTVTAHPENHASLFLSPVDVGGQKFNLDFDSGSSDLWMFSTELDLQVIGQHAAFDASKSTTFKEVMGSRFRVKYGDGSGASGTVGTDTVTIGGVRVENQVIELANNVSQSLVQDTNTDGLVGLAFSQLNTVSDGTKKTPKKTFFENVMPTLELPVFTADLEPDGSGVYEFGKIDDSKFQGELSWIPVQSESGFWQFSSTKFAISDNVFDNPVGSDAIADTGTSLLLVDQEVAEAYYAQVESAELNQKAGGFVYPCDAILPDLSVAIGDSYMATIPGEQITFTTTDSTNTTCFGGVQGNQGAGRQVFGDTLFKAQFVVFNGGNQSLGFGQKPFGRKGAGDNL